MQIAGFVKNSFVDYPTKIASVVFAPNCNMKCYYCHNYHILDKKENFLPEEDIFDFLSSHVGFIDAVVISGGEPTLQKDLPYFIKKIKDLGYLVKLDTNGSNFEVLKLLCDNNLVDYVAMDIKAPFDKYKLITNTSIDVENIKKSLQYLIKGKVDYEFRTTFADKLTLQDIENICSSIKGAKKYCLQKCNNIGDKKIFNVRQKLDFDMAKNIAKKYVQEVIVKGID